MKIGFIMIDNSNKKRVIDNDNLMKEWNWSRDNELGLNPEELYCDSHKKVWWACDNGHEWEAAVYKRNDGYNCPYCSNRKVLVGYNDLVTTNPELAKQWHPTKNGGLTPQDVTASSNKSVWWICDEGHEWKATVKDRKNGIGCPYCSGKKVLSGYNDLVTANPEPSKQWYQAKNGDLTPQNVATSSHKKVWWVCNNGHEFEAAIYNYVNGYGCKMCAKK